LTIGIRVLATGLIGLAPPPSIGKRNHQTLFRKGDRQYAQRI
jgi:hypothetical protein